MTIGRGPFDWRVLLLLRVVNFAANLEYLSYFMSYNIFHFSCLAKSVIFYRQFDLG